MSPPIDPAELSALIDGELPPERARKVEALIAQDPALRAEFETLRGLDARWRANASAALFEPMVRLPQAPAHFPLRRVAAVVVALILARIGGKFVEGMAPALLLNLAALALVAVTVLAAARADHPAGPARSRSALP
jgi:anti-sigma factor RsiW